jgi:solute carrier family 25 protein 38
MDSFQNSSVQKRVTELLSGHSTLKSFVAGSLSGSCSTILFQPFDVLKTRLQTANTCTSSLSSTRLVPILSQVVKDHQIFGLWRGTTPSLLRCVPGVGLYFCSLDWLQTHFCKNSNGFKSQPSAIQAVSFGLIARSFVGAVLIPVTVVKTRYESGIFSYGSISQALRHTYVSEGARGLMSGLVPTLMRDAPFSGLYFMFYSQLRNLLIISSPSASNTSSFSPILTFTCGLNAGLMASVVTHPMDVVCISYLNSSSLPFK